MEAHLTLLNIMGKFLCLARFNLVNILLLKFTLYLNFIVIGDLLLIRIIQGNNAYIFPGFGLGLIISGAIRVREEMLLAACKYSEDCIHIQNMYFATPPKPLNSANKRKIIQNGSIHE